MKGPLQNEAAFFMEFFFIMIVKYSHYTIYLSFMKSILIFS